MTLVVKKKVANCTLYESDYSKKATMRVDNVRLSYPHLDAKWAATASDTPAYSVNALLPKETHEEAAKLINAVIDKVIEARKGFRVAKDKRCLKDGDDTDKPENEGMYVLPCREPKNPPTLKAVVGGKLVNLTAQEAAAKFYGGCWGTVLFRIWPQDNEYGRRVNGGLQGVVFIKDGEPFGEGRIDDSDAYDDLGFDDDEIPGFDDDDDDL